MNEWLQAGLILSGVLGSVALIVKAIFAGYVAWLYRSARDKDVDVPGMLSIKKRPPEE